MQHQILHYKLLTQHQLSYHLYDKLNQLLHYEQLKYSYFHQ
mgnify:FL=1